VHRDPNHAGRLVTKTKVKLHDKTSAITQLLRLFGDFPDHADFNLSSSELSRLIENMRRRLGLPPMIDGNVTDVPGEPGRYNSGS
jgi:hypothetical protein